MLTTRNELGAGACAPYDREPRRDRDGRGRRLPPARGARGGAGRGAPIYAEIIGRRRRATSSADALRIRRAAPWPPRSERALARGGVAGARRRLRRRARQRDERAATRARRPGFAAGVRERRRPAARAASSRRPATSVAAAGALERRRRGARARPPDGATHAQSRDLDPACDGIDWIAKEARETTGRGRARPRPRTRRPERRARAARRTEGGDVVAEPAT